MAASLFAADADTAAGSGKSAALGQTNMTEHDPGGARRGAMGGLLGQPESGCRNGERHRHPGVLPDESALSPERQVSRRPGFLRRLLRRRQEARPARDRAHESGPQLGRRRRRRIPSGSSATRKAIPVRHTEDPRLFRTCMFTTYMTDYMPAIMREINSLYDVDGMFTNAWPPSGRCRSAIATSAGNCRQPGTLRLLGKIQRARHLSVEALRFHRQREEAVEFLFRQPGRRHPLQRRPGTARRDLRVVPVRQPGPRRRRYAHLGLRAARPRVQRRAKGQDVHQRDGGLVHRLARAGATSTSRSRKSRCGSTKRWPREWCPTTTSSAARTGMGEDRRWLEPARKYFNWMAQARPPLRQQALHRQHRAW